MTVTYSNEIKGAPSENPGFRRKTKVEFLSQEDAVKFSLPEYIWLFEKRTHFDGLTAKTWAYYHVFRRMFLSFQSFSVLRRLLFDLRRHCIEHFLY